MLGYWTDRWYHAMHSSMKLRIEFKNRYIIPYIKDHDIKKIPLFLSIMNE
jgi:hypothetical protein